MRVAYAGTPPFAVPALRALVDAGHELVLVLTQPDRPSGRGMKLRSSAVAEAAEALRLTVEKPSTMRSAESLALIEASRPDLMVVAAYGQILPANVLAVPRLGCVNIHASLLPRWRGAAPIHRAILAGDVETGVTLMQMDAGLDTGAMLAKRTCAIGPTDTTGTLTERLADMGASALVELLATPTPWPAEPQEASAATYAAKIGKAEARLDWAAPAATLHRAIRAFNPAPGAEFILEAEPLKVWSAELAAGRGLPGQVLPSQPGELVVGCGEGALRLLEVQRPGGRRLPAAEFLRGRERASP